MLGMTLSSFDGVARCVITSFGWLTPVPLRKSFQTYILYPLGHPRGYFF